MEPRQYYSDWVFRRGLDYHYCKLFCKPGPTHTGYDYYYCIFYPSQPRYVYYYDTLKRSYWGRLDLEGGPGKRFSLLDEADRKDKLRDLAESAFPEPASMPSIPGAEDGEPILPITRLPAS